jgi:hypothetical protein
MGGLAVKFLSIEVPAATTARSTSSDDPISNKKPQDSLRTLRLPNLRHQHPADVLIASEADATCLIFNLHALHCAVFGRARVINPHFLPGSQRSRYDFSGAIYNSRGRAQQKADRSFVA